MNDLHLENLPVRHLEWLFDPPGLPIPQRIVGKPQTTSALVRGAAGTGKTTLALGLALGIADALGGNVYYLSTEIAPVDVRFKLKPIGLEPGTALGLSERKEGARILTEHLRLVSDANVEEKGVRTRAALERVQTVIFDGLMPDARVVVIDAFSLVGDGGDATALRVQLAETIQAFDGCGVSVVLVEEAPVLGADWASFVVDLVFELGWGEDPDTRARIRQLSCPKSRFSTASCGPHDYGMEAGRLAVWPDLGTIAAQEFGKRTWGEEPMFERLDSQSSVLRGMVGADNTKQGDTQQLFDATPWERHIVIDLGPLTTVGAWTVRPNEGPHALVWALIHEATKLDARICWVQGVEYALTRTRVSIPLFAALQTLASLGLCVVVNTGPAQLTEVPASFEYAEGPRSVKRQFKPRHVSTLLGPAGVKRSAFAIVGELFRSLSKEPRWSALRDAAILRQPRALDWYLAQGNPAPDEEPYLRHALARNGRMDEAIARIPKDDPTRHRLLVAELHLNLFTPEGLAAAEPTYTELLADPRVSDADKKLMQEQLAEVRKALAT